MGKSSLFDNLWKNEPQLFRFWPTLTPEQRETLQHQISHIRLDILEKQKQLIQKSIDFEERPFEPFHEFAFSGNLERQLMGQQLIEQGRLGCLLLAGGQGTRLQFSGPKGMFPISVIKNKSLFQLCAEKVKAAGLKAGRPLNLAIMTSLENDKETRSFFEEHHFFGLAPSQISFFVQETLPFLDIKGKLFLQKPWQIAEGADGNGHSLLCFARSGILDQWMQQGIQYLHVILIDNPLADPFDAELLGFHQMRKAEITLKCTEKKRAEEKVGLLVKQNGRCRVIEYSEMALKDKEERSQEGRLKYCCANLSLFCFTLAFIKRVASMHSSLPLHKVWKIAPFVDQEGISHLSESPNAWKFETFIFDWLLYAQNVAALIYPREECFAPLKQAKGDDSPESVRKALQEADKRIIESITGLIPPSFPFELAQEFYYPTSALLLNWKGKQIANSYIES